MYSVNRKGNKVFSCIGSDINSGLFLCKCFFMQVQVEPLCALKTPLELQHLQERQQFLKCFDCHTSLCCFCFTGSIQDYLLQLGSFNNILTIDTEEQIYFVVHLTQWLQRCILLHNNFTVSQNPRSLILAISKIQIQINHRKQSLLKLFSFILLLCLYTQIKLDIRQHSFSYNEQFPKQTEIMKPKVRKEGRKPLISGLQLYGE